MMYNLNELCTFATLVQICNIISNGSIIFLFMAALETFEVTRSFLPF